MWGQAAVQALRKAAPDEAVQKMRTARPLAAVVAAEVEDLLVTHPAVLDDIAEKAGESYL